MIDIKWKYADENEDSQIDGGEFKLPVTVCPNITKIGCSAKAGGFASHAQIRTNIGQ